MQYNNYYLHDPATEPPFPAPLGYYWGHASEEVSGDGLSFGHAWRLHCEDNDSHIASYSVGHNLDERSKLFMRWPWTAAQWQEVPIHQVDAVIKEPLQDMPTYEDGLLSCYYRSNDWLTNPDETTAALEEYYDLLRKNQKLQRQKGALIGFALAILILLLAWILLRGNTIVYQPPSSTGWYETHSYDIVGIGFIAKIPISPEKLEQMRAESAARAAEYAAYRDCTLVSWEELVNRGGDGYNVIVANADWALSNNGSVSVVEGYGELMQWDGQTTNHCYQIANIPEDIWLIHDWTDTYREGPWVITHGSVICLAQTPCYPNNPFEGRVNDTRIYGFGITEITIEESMETVRNLQQGP